MQTAVLNISLRVQFDYDETRHDIYEAADHALCLAINPCYGTIEEGVQLTDHEISDSEVELKETYKIPYFADLEEQLDRLTIRK